ncbi:MAG: hypothetical protein JNN15_18865, partial [Blastocatellia bacterium]|nr:hypothetical protein [Blastocatellia bacterium]
FSDVKTDKAIALSSIFDYFGALQYKEQFFIIDACRNILDWKKRFRIGQLPAVEEIDPNKPIVSQYKLFATSPRTKAVDLGEHGAFTKALLDGLKGEGTAKSYDEEGEKYIVSVDRLFKYVEKKVLERKLNVSKDENNPIYQQPRIAFDGNLEFPRLAEIDSSEVSNQQLSVAIKTTPIPSNTELVLLSQNGEVSEAVSPIESKLVTLEDLKPMRYTVKLTAPNYTSNPKRKSVELYEPQRIEIALEKKASEIKATSIVSSTDHTDQPVTKSMGHIGLSKIYDILFDRPANKFIKPVISFKPSDLSEVKDEEIDEVKDKDIEIGNPKLTIRSADPTLPLEVIDSKGEVLGYDTEEIVLSDIKTGSYYAQLFTPEDKMTQQLIDWDDESHTVELVAPLEPYTSLTKTIIEEIGLKVHKNSTVELSEKLPYVASVKLSTILAFAAVAKNFPSLGWGNRLANIGLKSFSEITKLPSKSGLHIIIATEFVEEKEAAGYLANIETRLWKIDESVTEPSHFSTVKAFPSIAELAFAADAGAYYFSIEIKEERPVIFRLNLFDDRLTILVIHQHPEGKIQAFQYCLDPEADDLQNPTLMRRLEVLQRASLNNTKRHTEKNVRELVEEKSPIALCLNAYLLLYLKKTEDVKPIVDSLIKALPALPDSHVLHAEYLQRTKKEKEAKQAYLRALDFGLPVFLEGLEMLYFYVKKTKLEHRQVDFLKRVYDRRVKNALWTIWEPGTDSLKPGKRIEDQIGDSTTLVINTQNITATGGSSIHNAVQIQGSNVIETLIVGDGNNVFFGDYTRLKDAYINPWPVFERVNLDEFVGRDWIISEIDEFLNNKDRGYFILEA